MGGVRNSVFGVRCFLVGILLMLAGPVFAQALAERPPEEADRLYREVGEQLFCICGCRESLLSCTMNNCGPKRAERSYLRELSEDPSLDAVAVKHAMVERFGEKVLQVPPDSDLYTILVIAGLVLIAGFSAGFWVVTRRQNNAPPAEPSGGPVDPDIEARIERELKELD